MKLSNRIATINGAAGDADGWRILYLARDAAERGEDITMLCIGDHDSPRPSQF